jgi:predicted secreted protein with PEFG-CTERM motif
MEYKTYALMAVLLASVALVAPIGTTYATTNATTTNATTTNATEGDWLTFELNVDDQTFPIEYMIDGGSVNNMTISSENATLTAEISSTDVGTLDIRLPRNIIDAKTGEGSDAEFAAFIDNAEFAEPGEPETTEDMRTLSIGFPQGAETIDIIGTFVVPEFGTIAVIMLAVAIVGIVIATTRGGRFSFSPRL